MTWISAFQAPGSLGFGSQGSLNYSFPIPSGTLNPIPFPPNVNAVTQRPCFSFYNTAATSRLYLTGGWTDNLVFTENYTLARQGIQAPITPIVSGAPTGIQVGVTASGTGITGNVIVGFTYWDNVNARESSISGLSPILALSNQGVAISNLPTDGGGDPTVTHLNIYLSVGGNSPQFAIQRDLGTTSCTVNLPALALGQFFVANFTKFPRCRYNTMYHDMQTMAGDDQHPDRLYFSNITLPEQYGGLFLRTRRGERIIGIVVVRDFLIVLCPTASYLVQGYTVDDLEMLILEPQIGCIAHAAIALCHGLAIIPAQIGVYLCTGNSFHPISNDFQQTWRNDFAFAEIQYENSWAVNDVETNTYKLFVGNTGMVNRVLTASNNQDFTASNMYWCLDYTAMLGQSAGQFTAPKLSLDMRSNIDLCAAILTNPNANLGHLFTGNAGGHICQENVSSNGDVFDSGINKRWVVRTGHNFFDDPGGDDQSGNTFTEIWAFVEKEADGYNLNLYLGDEGSGLAVAPTYSEIVPAGQLGHGPGGVCVAKEVHFTTPMKSGRGISFEIDSATFNTIADPNTGHLPTFNGWGGSRIPGYGPTRAIGQGSA